MGTALKSEPVAPGVSLVRGGRPRVMNVYLVADGDGVTAFDAGVAGMGEGILAAAAERGGLQRVVLGHAHVDHRGAAPELGVPVYCHPAERADAEADGGLHYFELGRLGFPASFYMRVLLKRWDGGPVAIAGTIEEGDRVGDFEVVHLPGHAPGLIALWRASDGLVLASDAFYTLDPRTGIKGRARLPLDGFNLDRDEARKSLRKLAALEPAVAWPGHAGAVSGPVRTVLEGAAAD